MRPKDAILILLLLLVVAFTGWKYAEQHATPSTPPSVAPPVTPAAMPSMATGKIILSGKTFTVEFADTPDEQEQGLSGRTELGVGRGMLFRFPGDGQYPFWMPDMHFSIDMLWIDKDFRVVHIEHDVSPDSYPQTFSSPTPARYVLEVPAGATREIGTKIGEKITFLSESP